MERQWNRGKVYCFRRMVCVAAVTVLSATTIVRGAETAAEPNLPANTADTPKRETPKPIESKREAPKVDPFTLLLRSDDAAQQQKGVEGIKALFAHNPGAAIGKFKAEWLSLLLTTQHYQDVLDLSIVVSLNSASDMQVLEQVQRARVKSLIALGKQEEALANAKSYFNVSSMKGTAEAIMAVVQCLNINPTSDNNRLERFKAQQLLSSNSVSALKELANGPSVLGSIHVNTEPYDAAIRSRVDDDFTTLTERGNLLLLADRAKEARDAFERAYVVADDRQLNLASENFARAMKAEDGNVSRANEWALSIRPPAKPPAQPPKP